MSDEKMTADRLTELLASYCSDCRESPHVFGVEENKRWKSITSAIESLCAERDQAQKHLEHETAAHLATIETRDYFEETIQECHIQLGGDGEWSNVHDLAEELPEMICEAQAEAERLREENAKKINDWLDDLLSIEADPIDGDPQRTVKLIIDSMNRHLESGEVQS